MSGRALAGPTVPGPPNLDTPVGEFEVPESRAPHRRAGSALDRGEGKRPALLALPERGLHVTAQVVRSPHVVQRPPPQVLVEAHAAEPFEVGERERLQPHVSSFERYRFG